MINVGLIGFGLSGRYLQAPFFMTHPRFKLKTIVTTRDVSKTLFPKTIKEQKIEPLLNDPEIDLISICTPNATHYQLAKEALLSGKHVLVEKPLTAKVSEAEELFNIAKKQEKVLATFHNRRFDSDFLTIQALIESKVLGEIQSFEAHFDRDKSELNNKSWKEEVSPSNGILYDLGSHLIDQAICLFGKPSSFAGKIFTERVNSKIDDAFNLELKYNQLSVNLRSSLMVKEVGPRYTIHGAKGSFIKYGLDIQEDQLKAELWPNAKNFGEEPEEHSGLLTSTFDRKIVSQKVPTLKGSWIKLFDNLASTINQESPLFISSEDILTQLQIMEIIKNEGA